MPVIMRYAVLQEDEQEDKFVKSVDTKEEAEKWIANQKDEYFKPTDYYIVG